MPKRVLPLEDYIVRIEKHDGTKLGTGFFVGPDEVLPSAHIFKGIPDPIGDVRLVAPIRRPPTAGDAHVDKLFPKTWDVDQVFPDIAWLTVQPFSQMFPIANSFVYAKVGC
jgi:hypothetical protein